MTTQQAFTTRRGSLASTFLLPFRRTGLVVTISALVIVLTIVVGRIAASSASWTRSELTVDQSLSRLHVPIGDALALTVGWVLSPVQGFVLILIICAIVAWKVRDWSVTVPFTLVVLGGWLSSELVKIIVHRARPDFHLLAHPLSFEVNFSSFPSGHTCLITAVMVGFIYLLRGRANQGLMIATAVIVVFLVALSRLYIGAHYPTDVIGSMVYTTAAMTGFLTAWNRWLAAPAGRILSRAGSRRGGVAR